LFETDAYISFQITELSHVIFHEADADFY